MSHDTIDWVTKITFYSYFDNWTYTSCSSSFAFFFISLHFKLYHTLCSVIHLTFASSSSYSFLWFYIIDLVMLTFIFSFFSLWIIRPILSFLVVVLYYFYLHNTCFRIGNCVKMTFVHLCFPVTIFFLLLFIHFSVTGYGCDCCLFSLLSLCICPVTWSCVGWILSLIRDLSWTSLGV